MADRFVVREALAVSDGGAKDRKLAVDEGGPGGG